jgi:hypothetical protein
MTTEPGGASDVAMNEFGDPNLTGWWIGLIIGFVVVVVVVVVVGALLASAARIITQVRAATHLLEGARTNTQPLSELRRTDQTLRGIAADAIAARQALGG